MWVGFIQSTEDLNRTKADLPPARGNSASTWPSVSNCNSSLSLQPTGLLHQILDLPSPHNHVIRFLKINLFLSIYIYILLVPFLWWTLTNTADHHSTHYTSIYPRGGEDLWKLETSLECGDKCKGILQWTNPLSISSWRGVPWVLLSKCLLFPVLLIFYKSGWFLIKFRTVAQQTDSPLTSWRQKTFQGNSLLLPTLSWIFAIDWLTLLLAWRIVKGAGLWSQPELCLNSALPYTVDWSWISYLTFLRLTVLLKR